MDYSKFVITPNVEVEMKTLIFVGSPKKNGQSMQLVKRFMNNIQGDVEIINVFGNEAIKPCLDCGFCKTNQGCSQNDNFKDVLVKIDEADCIVLASPMWFGNISGPLMSYLTRLNTFANGYTHRKDRSHQWNKTGLLFMTTGAKWNSMAKSVEATVEFLFKEMDALMIDCVYANKTDVLDTSVNKQALLKCDHAAELVNSWYEDKCNGKYIQYGYSSSNFIEYELNNINN